MNHFQRMKDLREDHDKTQKDIAKYLETTQAQIYKYEKGIQMMGIDKYIKLAKLYDISLDYLAGLTDTPTAIGGGKYKIIKEHE